jgi:hypothetical protein
MSLFSTTGIELIERTARILKDWKGGTCTSGGASTFIDTTRTEGDDYFQNTTPVSRVRIITTTDAAAPQGQERTISDWVVSTGTGTVTAAWTTANPGAGDTYGIMSEYSWDEVFHAINDVFDSVKNLPVLERADHSVALVSSVYEYDIPIGFTHIYRVTMESGTGNYGTPIPPEEYRIVRGTPTPRLHFVRQITSGLPEGISYPGLWADSELSGGKLLRIEGFGYQTKLVSDTDLCFLDPIFVCYQAAADLNARRITRADTDPDEYRTQYQLCQAKANEYKPKTIANFPPNMKRVY